MFTPAFIYDGSAVDLNTWQQRVSSDGSKTVIEWTSPDQTLAVRVTKNVYSAFPVTEYVPELICRGSQPTKIIETFRTLSTAFPLEIPGGECTIRAVHGARTKTVDFCARSFVLSEQPEEQSISFTCTTGHSSAAWMPWFGVDLSPRNGWEIAIGWTGAWCADFKVEADTVQIEIGMADSRFYMKEGERFRLPGILLFKRDNVPVMTFQSIIRDFMIRHKSPRDSQGRVLKPRFPLTGSGGNRPADFLKRVIEYAAKHDYPFDTFWVDAGWYGPPHQPDTTTNCGDCWYKYVGDWRVNPVCHPDGLRPVADAAGAHNMAFLLWFEPERTTEITPIFAEHPEYFRKVPGEHPHGNLLDLGNRSAQEWIFNTVCSHIDEIGIGVYRQDFNMDPLPVWRHYDEPDRQGVNEIKHIMGLYAYLDALRARYPDMLLENCAGGGRRMDYEMVSRAHSYCRSDYYIPRHSPELPQHEYQILMGQNALMNTMAYVPFQSGETNPVVMFNDYEMFSMPGTGTVFTPADWNKKFPGEDSFTPEENAWLVKRFKQIARLRDILCGELYWLTAEKTDQREDIWTAYQGWNPELNAGTAVFFRRKEAEDAVKTFALKNIDPALNYKIEDMNGAEWIVKGEELANWTVRLDQPRSVYVIFYSVMLP